MEKNNQTNQIAECTKCHKRVSNFIVTPNGPVCESCMNATTQRKKNVGGIIIGILVIAVLCGGYYFSSKSARTGIGFNGIENIIDSMTVNVETETVAFNISSSTAISAPVTTQNPISNISDFRRVIDSNISNAKNSKADKIIIPAICSFFSFNTNCFVSDSESIIKAFADAYLQTDKQATILIEGYTCDLGSNEINLELSKLRAEAAKQVLVNAGVPSNKIEIKWYGKTRYQEFSYPAKREYRRVIVSIK